MAAKIVKERTHFYAPSINIVMAFTILGNPEEEEIRQAIVKAVQRHEILNCSVHMDEKGDCYYSPVNTTHRIETQRRQSPDDWKELINEQERIPFDLSNGELIRFFILQGDSSDPQLIIVAHHLAGDGISMLYLIRDIMEALENPGKELRPMPLRLFDESMVPDNVKLSPMIRLLLKFTNRQWSKNKRIFTDKDYREMFCAYWMERRTKAVMAQIAGVQLQKLTDSCRAHKITVNSAIITAFLLAAKTEHDVGLAVNIRPEGFEGMGNYASGISIQYKPDANKAFWENAGQVHSLVLRKLNNNSKKYFLLQFMAGLDPTLIDAAYFSAFTNYENSVAARVADMFGYNGNPKGISITNLTKASIPSEYGKYGIADLIFAAPLVANAKRIISVVTLKDTMTLTMQFSGGQRASEEEAIFDSAIRILREM